MDNGVRASEDELDAGVRAVKAAEAYETSTIVFIIIASLLFGFVSAHFAPTGDELIPFGFAVAVGVALSAPLYLRAHALNLDTKRRHLFMDRN